jgi:WD40 repeat protein
LGSSNDTSQIYDSGNLTAPPIKIKGFDDWPRNMVWSPDSQHIDVVDNGRTRIFEVATKEVIQIWEVDPSDLVYGSFPVAFVDNGKKLTWMYRDGTYLYDFEKKVKYYWTPRTSDHLWGSMGFSFLNKKNTVITHDGDSTVRFWKL